MTTVRVWLLAMASAIVAAFVIWQVGGDAVPAAVGGLFTEAWSGLVDQLAAATTWLVGLVS